MIVSHRDYNHFRTLLLNSSIQCSTNKLIKLKYLYENEINSARRFACIDNLQDLIEVLEKRDFVSENDITVFEDIATVLENKQLLKEINKRFNETQENGSPTPHFITEESSRDAKSRVYNIIINELGVKWIEFARSLNMRERQLDELKKKFPNEISPCVKEVLKFHENNVHPREWKQQLLDALTAARRNDLRKDVEKIFNHFS